MKDLSSTEIRPLRMGGLLTLLVVLGLTPLSAQAGRQPATHERTPRSSDCGPFGNPTGSPIGGGAGYAHLVSSGEADYLVNDVAGLLAALSLAAPTEIVYVDDDAKLDLTGYVDIGIPAGVTLASGRGQAGSEGALLFTDEYDSLPLLRAEGDDVRLTGLRLRGPDPEIGSSAYWAPNSRGIQIDDFDRLEVDNCEMSAWSHAAVYLGDTSEAFIHHNFMHHNRRTGLGYGVVLYQEVDVLIEANLFNHNRHDIAGNGYRYQSYEARYNISLTSTTSHNFDMHGENEKQGTSPYAGDWIHIHHNLFLAANYPGVHVRGRPRTGARIEYNWFAHPNNYGQKAIRQSRYFGNFVQKDNCFGFKGWFLSSGGNSNWMPLAHSGFPVEALKFGDFDADQKTDVFRTTGGQWYVSYGGVENWVPLSFSGYPGAKLALGNFIGDDRTDVFCSTGSQWLVSDGGTSSWQTLSTSGYLVEDLGFADFDGDNYTDVFRANGTQWLVSYGGQSAWTPLASSGIHLNDLALGDFNGDNLADVFYGDGSQWWVSYGGTSSWSPLASSGYVASQLAFADFDGDDRTDVFLADGTQWRVSYGGSSSWTPLATSGYKLPALRFGDFDGDNRADVFRSGRP